MNYLELLENSFKETKGFESNPDMSRFEYLAENIFGFTTYENKVSALMGRKCLEVCKAISDRQTFEYIKPEEGNLWYLIMVNMPFFQDKLNWGTSIRGAWWDFESMEINTCGLFENRDQVDGLSFNRSQWDEFINAMISFTQDDTLYVNETQHPADRG